MVVSFGMIHIPQSSSWNSAPYHDFCSHFHRWHHATFSIIALVWWSPDVPAVRVELSYWTWPPAIRAWSTSCTFCRKAAVLLPVHVVDTACKTAARWTHAGSLYAGRRRDMIASASGSCLSWSSLRTKAWTENSWTNGSRTTLKVPSTYLQTTTSRQSKRHVHVQLRCRWLWHISSAGHRRNSWLCATRPASALYFVQQVWVKSEDGQRCVVLWQFVPAAVREVWEHCQHMLAWQMSTRPVHTVTPWSSDCLTWRHVIFSGKRKF